MRTIEIPPEPSPLIESIRSIGYSLGTALADLVDNSITAEARNIKIFTNLEMPKLRIGILDDGNGMDGEALIQSMRLGSRSPLEDRESHDLGRFGLGLKTASFSQCRVLTVVSRSKGNTAAAQWDLNLVECSGKWQVRIPEDLTAIPWTEHLGSSGTLVLWEELDATNRDGDSRLNLDDFVRQMDEASTHLGLVFHRYLTGEDGRNRIDISLNGRRLKPFDPFHAKHPATIAGPEELIRVANETVRVQAFTLPHHGKVTPVEWEKYGGPQGYLRNQGFYLYRERRLIIYGTWFGLARQMDLTKLARVRIDMPSALDGAWKIDVKKSSAQLPPPIRARLRRIIETFGAPSKRAYRYRGRRLVQDNRVPVWGRFQKNDQVYYRVNQEHPMIVNLLYRLSPETRGDLLKVLQLTGATLPIEALYADLGEDSVTVIRDDASEQALRYAALTTFDHLIAMAKSISTAHDLMRVTEPFRSNWEQTERILMDSGTTRVSE